MYKVLDERGTGKIIPEFKHHVMKVYSQLHITFTLCQALWTLGPFWTWWWRKRSPNSFSRIKPQCTANSLLV